MPFSAFMEVSLLVLTHSSRSSSLTESRKCLMKVPSVIYFGPTPMIDVVGVSPPEELVTLSDRIFLSNSTTPMAS
jgi:hypothetical protein